MRIYLSPRRFSLYQECPRCFFDETFLKLKRPRGAYPTLPGAIDERMKAYCDTYRQQGILPIQLKNFVDGMEFLQDQKAIDRMRFWKEGLSTTVERTVDYAGKPTTHAYYIQGSIDELLFDPDTDTFAIPDFKTRREAPDESYSEKYYQTSMNTYAFLLDESGLPCNGRAILWYLWPETIASVNENRLLIQFGSTCQELAVNGSVVHTMLDEIAMITPRDTILQKNIDAVRPELNSDCEYCNYKRK